MNLFVALLIVVIYWVLDAFYISSELAISFTYALMYKNILVKVFVTLAIIFISFLPTMTSKKEKKNEKEDKELEIFKKVSQIITSPIPITAQTNQIASLLENTLDTTCSFICEYQNDNIFVLNTDENLQKFGIKQIYLPHAEVFPENSIDEVLALFFIEKRDFLIKEVETPFGVYTGFFNALVREGSSKPFGIFVILCNASHDYTHIIKSLSSLVAFSISLHQKKVASEKFQEQLAQKDKILNIPTNTVLQTIIEQEYHRFIRYGSNLTLIIIEIDHIQNLSNIFDTQTVINLKKEFATVISKNIRTTDTFGKWTENRFAIVAPTIDFRAGKNFATKLTRLLSSHRFAKVGRITCSYGVTSLGENDTIAVFRKRAEDALNTAIDKGGNAIELKILV